MGDSMTVSELEHFKNLLTEREDNLVEWLNSLSSVKGDDASKAQSLLAQIKDALARVDSHTFGSCKVCDEYVELHRLEVQPVAEVCLGCISDKEKKILEEELFVASKIHRALLPQTTAKIDGFDLAAKSMAAGGVGGDYYDFLPSSDGSTIRVLIADTVGKGLPAGLLMSNLQGAMRVIAETIKSPASLITRVNQWFCRNIPVTKFVSLACLSVETQNGKNAKIKYTNAGHWSPILIRTNGEVELLNPTGGLLGVHDEFSYDEQNIELFPGDIVVLYTDGITEAQNAEGKMYEEDRLTEFLTTHRSEPAETILENLLRDVGHFTGNSKLDDDLTVIVLQKK
jgi:phosphoserine phosphatase RsbU/P